MNSSTWTIVLPWLFFYMCSCVPQIFWCITIKGDLLIPHPLDRVFQNLGPSKSKRTLSSTFKGARSSGASLPSVWTIHLAALQIRTGFIVSLEWAQGHGQARRAECPRWPGACLCTLSSERSAKGGEQAIVRRSSCEAWPRIPSVT